MSDPQLEPPPSGRRALLLGCLGTILLLPGLCSLVFAVAYFYERQPDDMVLPVIPYWLVSLLISAAGVALITEAIRRGRRS
jgi:lipid-A-disaccharide synthase-like uncharacterized protein